jgi:sec-independent protein translocase protein TatA
MTCPLSVALAGKLINNEIAFMGISGISFWEILLILLAVLLLFGSKKLPGIASDLGHAIRDFRRSLSSEQQREELREQERPREDPPAPSGRAGGRAA